jgi:dephospho-CoA kinase
LTYGVFTVALTGGVGSGKSTIAEWLARLGAGIVDADAIAHELTQPGGAAIEPLHDAFGPRAIRADGALDRAWMRAHVFADATERLRLEGILHPLIRTRMRENGDAHARAGAPYVVAVIPLLVESGRARERAHRVLVVDCTVETQLQRVAQRAGIDAALAKDIVAAQASRAQRLAVADDVIFNEAPLPEISAAVARLHASYLEHARLLHVTADSATR